MPTENWLKFRVRLHSSPSPAYAFYEGSVTVFAEDAECAKERALGQLRRGAFPERSRDSWVIDAVEVVG